MSALSKGNILDHLIEAILEVNRVFWLTIRDLFVRPEKVVNSYLSKEKPFDYVNPFRYAFLIVSFYVAISTLIQFDAASVISKTDQNLAPSITNLIDLLYNATAFFMFVSIIPAAWIMKKLFSKSGKSSSECYVILLYGYAQITLIMITFFLPLAYLLEDHRIIQATLIFSIPYGIWQAYRIFDYSLFSAGWRALLSQIAYNFVHVAFIFVIATVVGAKQYYDEKNSIEEKKQTTEISKATKKTRLNLN